MEYLILHKSFIISQVLSFKASPDLVLLEDYVHSLAAFDLHSSLIHTLLV